MRISGINLLSDDCVRSAQVYSFVFGFTLAISGKYHSEVITESGLRILFSPNSEKCRVSVGSFSIEGEPTQKFKESGFFTIEQTFPDRGYHAYLDKYGNRIWFIIR
jgi:hypothetical protein